MKLSQLKHIIKETIKDLQEQTPNIPSDGTGTGGSGDGNATFYNPGDPLPQASPCCSAIQSLKPHIPIAQKQLYLDALADCGCNQNPQVYQTSGISSMGSVPLVPNPGE
jgi:hypothetical protein